MNDEKRALDDVLRSETPKVVGALARRFGRFDVAEDAVQEALLAAAQQWPVEGVPENPCAWLTRVGYRRMIDLLRSERSHHRRELALGAAERAVPAGSTVDSDDSLSVLLMCCHPDLSPASRVALTLRAVGGLTTAEIAHAFGASEATMGSRISRAKQQLRAGGTRFSTPSEVDRADRMQSALHVLYLIFNEGYTASAGDLLTRVDLAAEAIRLARLLVRSAPDDSEPIGLLSLMLLTEARRPARVGQADELVPLAEQDRSLWDQALLHEGIALIDTIWSTGARGAYVVQAAIAALHSRADSFGATDWHQIAALYLLLEQRMPTAPVRLGRVVAAAHAFGPAVGLQLLDDLDAETHVASDPLTEQRYHAVRAHLLEQRHDHAVAAAHFREAARLTANSVERDYLLGRAEQAGARRELS